MKTSLEKYREHGRRIEDLIRPATFPLALKIVRPEKKSAPVPPLAFTCRMSYSNSVFNRPSYFTTSLLDDGEMPCPGNDDGFKSRHPLHHQF